MAKGVGPDDVRRVYSPSEAAEELGVSASMLRRMARTYAELFDDLVPHQRFGWQYHDQVLERMRKARASELPFREALESLAGISPDVPAVPGADQLGNLVAMMARIEERLSAIEQRLDALPAPEPDRADVEDLERRVKYLQGELERRDQITEEGERKRRRWWWPW